MTPRILVFTCLVALAGAWVQPAVPLTRQRARRASTAMSGAALTDGDVITVVGASGNVGKLVALRLSDQGRFKVRCVTRDTMGLSAFLGDRENVELFQADLRQDDGAGALAAALEGSAGVVICTGTTAFPTKAWSADGGDVTFAVLKALLDSARSEAGFDFRAAIRALDEQGLNTPERVDNRGTRAVLDAWAAPAKKRLLLMSSIGVTKRDGFPFKVLNACGVLEAKAAAETAVKEAAAAEGFDWTVVRPGQLLGGPYDNNYYLGTLFQLDRDAETQRVVLERGDTILGDVLRSALAEVIVASLTLPETANAEFAVINEKGDPPSEEQLRAQLTSALA